MIYELLALHASDDPELRIRDRDEQLCAMTWEVSNYFERGAFDEAAIGYQQILQSFPEDPVAKTMLRGLSVSLQPEMPTR
jgi:hypothetical protein